MPFRRFLACAILATTLLICGCGKSSSSTTTTPVSNAEATNPQPHPKATAPLAATELRSLGDGICKRLAARRASNRAETATQVASEAAELASFEHMISGELAALSPPAPLASTWQEIVKGSDKLAAYTGEVAELAREGKLNSGSARSIVAARTKLESELLALARRDGFDSCARTV